MSNQRNEEPVQPTSRDVRLMVRKNFKFWFFGDFLNFILKVDDLIDGHSVNEIHEVTQVSLKCLFVHLWGFSAISKTWTLNWFLWFFKGNDGSTGIGLRSRDGGDDSGGPNGGADVSRGGETPIDAVPVPPGNVSSYSILGHKIYFLLVVEANTDRI